MGLEQPVNCGFRRKIYRPFSNKLQHPLRVGQAGAPKTFTSLQELTPPIYAKMQKFISTTYFRVQIHFNHANFISTTQISFQPRISGFLTLCVVRPRIWAKFD